ncbi:MAG: chemotaxis protein CheW [Gammaproteobacteria bacterium]|nr:MAG: chemotaxis protein CheW [Gammaproteobacteria bacterium]
MPEDTVDEYLTFSLGEEEYAIDILRVREIRSWEAVTRIPFAESWECGLVNVRGAIVPVVDLRRRLGLADTTFDKHTVVILVGRREGERDKVSGLVVDQLNGVIAAGRTAIQDAPHFKSRVDMRYVAGLTESDGRMIILLNLDTLLNASGEVPGTAELEGEQA